MKSTVGILKYAMEMEKQGYEFFKSNAEKMRLASAKQMFEKLAEVEMDHYHYIKEQLDYIEAHNEVKDVDFDLSREKDLFEERAEKEMLDQTVGESMTPDLTVLRTAYLIERDYAEFYKKAANEATDPKAKKLFEALAAWEAGHEQLFKQEYDRQMQEYMNQPWGG
ncbi:ferritin-like domain-containing protein [Clostridium formicaceticum]|uniref:Rubrerythrin n=1 Tax=Clostridium formicaceticum TaxID=1497 RepID=A0AAC9RS78_9CLOT|nr:ferritin family protein [Clostridium formicaceticum]AOY74789.1 rubrerythrin [Clostridium formicaceticum]ARE89180.1 putative trifunctional 2-polyprenylphenol hydroxylase domain-containing protein [Clostridium formicaceticum]